MFLLAFFIPFFLLCQDLRPIFAEEVPVFSNGSEYDWLVNQFKSAKVENKKALVYFVVTKSGKVERGKCENCKLEDSLRINGVFKSMPDFMKPAYNRKQAINYPIRMWVKG